METRWLYTISENFSKLREASKDTCIIPMGCVEKHGLHLPLGTDIIHCSHIAHMASQLETVCVFPDFVFGDVPGIYHNTPDGTITLPLNTQILLLEQLCANIEKQGFKKILLYNGHGGNMPWLRVFSREIANRNFNFVLGTVTMHLPAPHTMAEIILNNGSGAIPEINKEDEELLIKYHKQNMLIGHACMGETAFMMGIDPDSVRLDRLGIESGKPLGVTDYFQEAGIEIRDSGWDIEYPNNYCGDDPIGCNERIGKAALRIEAERLANAIKVFKDDENLTKWYNNMKTNGGKL